MPRLDPEPGKDVALATAVVDLLVLHEWVYDGPFVARVLRYGAEAGVRVAAAGPADLTPWLTAIRAGVRPGRVLDRASDVCPEAAALADAAKAAGVLVTNDPDRARAAVDKARMHLALMASGVHVPHTVVLSPRRGVALDPARLARLGRPFVLKPARGSGGEGVVLDATGPDDVKRARAAYPSDAILAQERIVWTALDGHPAYFRVFWCLGEIHACFWNPDTRRYTAVSRTQRAWNWHDGLADVARAIARVAHMDLFSTEVAVTADGRFVSVDYVNDMCDLRMADEHPDGVPVAVVEAIARRLVSASRGLRA